MKTIEVDEWISNSKNCTQVLISSSHVNIYNNECSYTILNKVVEVVRNIGAFVFCFITPFKRCDFTGLTLVYIANADKTYREVLSLEASKYKSRYCYFVDGASADFLPVSQLRARLSLKDMFWFVRNLGAVLKAARVLFSENKVEGFLIKTIYFTRFLSCLALIRSLKLGVDFSSPRSVLNFFSGSYFGSCLNSAFKLQGLPYFSYIWGSNLKGMEQQCSEVKNLLVKSKYDLVSYQDRKDFDELNLHVVGNLSFTKRVELMENPEFDVLLIDTCYSDLFGFKDKANLYHELFKILEDKKIHNVCVKPHPGSNLEDLNVLLSGIKKIDITVIKNVSQNLEQLYRKSKIIVNVNSTEILYLRYCSLKVINLFPYFFSEYSNSNVESNSQFCKTNLLDVYSFSQLNADWDEYLLSENRIDRDFDMGGVIAANKLGNIVEAGK